MFNWKVGLEHEVLMRWFHFQWGGGIFEVLLYFSLLQAFPEQSHLEVLTMARLDQYSQSYGSL